MRFELDQVGVDDRRQRDLVQVDLLAQDQVQQEVEGPLEHGGLHVVGHVHSVAPRGLRITRVSFAGPGGRRPPGLPRRNAVLSAEVRSVVSAAMTRVFSGIQPTGDLHLGNLLGAVRNWVDDQHDADSFYCIVDLHALTVPKEPGELGRKSLELAQLLIACGLDPEVCTLFVQSHVHEHAELAWLIQCVTAWASCAA